LTFKRKRNAGRLTGKRKKPWAGRSLWGKKEAQAGSRWKKKLSGHAATTAPPQEKSGAPESPGQTEKKGGKGESVLWKGKKEIPQNQARRNWRRRTTEGMLQTKRGRRTCSFKEGRTQGTEKEEGSEWLAYGKAASNSKRGGRGIAYVVKLSSENSNAIKKKKKEGEKTASTTLN